MNIKLSRKAFLPPIVNFAIAVCVLFTLLTYLIKTVSTILYYRVKHKLLYSTLAHSSHVIRTPLKGSISPIVGNPPLSLIHTNLGEPWWVIKGQGQGQERRLTCCLGDMTSSPLYSQCLLKKSPQSSQALC